MHDEYNIQIPFNRVKVGRKFVERIFGRSVLYRKLVEDTDANGVAYNAVIFTPVSAEPCYFHAEDQVYTTQ